MGKGSTGAAAGGGAIYGLGIFGALFYYWQQARLVLGIHLGDLPEGHLLAGVHGLRGVQGARRINGRKDPRFVRPCRSLTVPARLGTDSRSRPRHSGCRA